jgi:AraC-like DNA-binding protein
MAVSPAPTNVRVRISEDELCSLYLGDRLTIEQVAARFGVAATTVRRRFRDLGISVRPRGPVPGFRCRRSRRSVTAPIQWTADLAYAVGLIATDGNLSRVRWGISLASNDIDLLATARRCLHLENSITRYTDSHCYHIQWRDRDFYNWLIGLGLTPAKSLTLGPLVVPDEHFADFFRGCIDGDGTVLVYTDRYHAAKKVSYVYERLYVSLVSASRPFLDWVRARVRALVGIAGEIHERRKVGRRPVWCLRYAKAESIQLIRWMYYSPNLPSLARKRAKAERFLSPLGSSPVRPVGRPRVGWLYNGAVPDVPGWSNGSLVALKTPCPQGRAGSNPAPGTSPIPSSTPRSRPSAVASRPRCSTREGPH